MSVQEMATRKSKNFKNDCATENPNSHKIIDVDCEYADRKFIISCLPCPLPSLFTIRFTAPENFTQGDVIVVKDKELPVRTPGMVNASTGLFMAGAVMHCDVDMDREIAFFWQSSGGTGGVMPNISYDEQFAGFYDVDGAKVYVKTVEIPLYKGGSSLTRKNYPHNIANLKKVIDLKSIWSGHPGNLTTLSNYILFSADQENIEVIIKSYDASAFTATVTLYYTCNGR